MGRLSKLRDQQTDRVGCNTLFFPGKTEPLLRGRLDADLVLWNTGSGCDTLPHGWEKGLDIWLQRLNRSIEMSKSKH